MSAGSLRLRSLSRRRSVATGPAGQRSPKTPAHVPKGTPRWRRFVRALWRSPLVRVACASLVATQIRSSYLRFDAQRAAWGSSVVAPTARADRAAGSVLQPTDIRWIRLPMVAVPAGTVTSGKSLVGRRLLSDVGAGEVLVLTRFAPTRLSAVAAKTGRDRVAVTITQREIKPVVAVGDRVAIVDVSGATVTENATAVQVSDQQVTVSIPTAELNALVRALAGPVTVGVLGPLAASER